MNGCLNARAIFGAMEVNTNPTKILDPSMTVKVMQRERSLNPNEPQNFLIESASVGTMLDTYRRLFPDSMGYWRLHGHQKERWIGAFCLLV